ncbi:MAG TPA: T9SS type A sorting domain-containing protein, partial [Chitinophagaceae bacterium]|nr:T9SS type A sorting domain-containing protein [Chitinophagaceae bacterium]
LKGAFLLRMLRWTLGDRAFFDGLRDYLNDTSLQYSFAHVSDLQAHLEASGNTNLNYFFNQWYYGQGYPSFNVTWQQNINNYAFITIRQTTSDPSVTFFKVPLALTFKNGTQSKTFIVNDSANNQSAVLDIGFTADTVLIDPDKQLISKNNHSAKLQPASTILNDIKIMPNPFRGRLSVIINNPGRQQWLFQVYSTEGKKLFSQNFHTPGADASLNISLPLNLPAGIYFLKIDAGDIHIVKKMIKAQPY